MTKKVLTAVTSLRRVLPPVATVRASTAVVPASFVVSRRYVSMSRTEGLTARRNDDKKATARTVEALTKELTYITDPWHLVRRIERFLSVHEFDDALAMVELASSTMQTTVAWNHLIDYLLQQQRISKAMATFNNMKKRAQFPNAQTYTVIFRGLAATDHPKNALVEAIKIFNLLKNDTRLRPTIIHANALMTVCSRALDLDMLFITAAEIEDLGLEPQAATYDIMFTALRSYIFNELGALNRAMRAKNLESVLNRARALWQDVMRKWESGELAIDEELVCSYARLQLFKREADKFDALSVFNRVMGLPNYAKDPPKTKTLPTITHSRSPDFEENFQSPKSLEKPQVAHQGVMVRPGKNTLSVILITLNTVVGDFSNIGTHYWNLFINELGVIPDKDLWVRMIGLLSQSRSSAQAAHFVKAIPPRSAALVQSRSFRIAMEACVRDNINPDVMINANSILRSMHRHLSPNIDIHTLRLYLRVALVSNSVFRHRADDGDRAGAKLAYGMQITSALAELWYPYCALYHRYFKSEEARNVMKGRVRLDANSTLRKPDTDKKQMMFDLVTEGQVEVTLANGPLYNCQREVIALGRMMVGAFSKVIEERMLEGNLNLADMKVACAQINSGVRAFFAARPPVEPKWLKNVKDGGSAIEQYNREVAEALEEVSKDGEGIQELIKYPGGEAVPKKKKLAYDIEMPELDAEFRLSRHNEKMKSEGHKDRHNFIHHPRQVKDSMWDTRHASALKNAQVVDGQYIFPPGQSVAQVWVGRNARKRAAIAKEMAVAERWMYERSNHFFPSFANQEQNKYRATEDNSTWSQMLNEKLEQKQDNNGQGEGE